MNNYDVLQAQILRESAGSLRGSRNSVVRASTKVGGYRSDEGMQLLTVSTRRRNVSSSGRYCKPGYNGRADVDKAVSSSV